MNSYQPDTARHSRYEVTLRSIGGAVRRCVADGEDCWDAAASALAAVAADWRAVSSRPMAA